MALRRMRYKTKRLKSLLQSHPAFLMRMIVSYETNWYLYNLVFKIQYWKGGSQNVHQKMGVRGGWSGLNSCTLPPGGGRVPWVVRFERVGGGFIKIRLILGSDYRFTTREIFIPYLLKTLTEIGKFK